LLRHDSAGDSEEAAVRELLRAHNKVRHRIASISDGPSWPRSHPPLRFDSRTSYTTAECPPLPPSPKLSQAVLDRKTKYDSNGRRLVHA
jgi:hypothetical protein